MNSSIPNFEYKTCILLIKYIPIISIIIQILYLGLYLIGYKIELLINISGVSLLYFIVIYKVLKVFRFCVIQKIILTYNIFTDSILSFGLNIHYMLFVLGILLITIILKLKA